jgi:hypothetical protein
MDDAALLILRGFSRCLLVPSCSRLEFAPLRFVDFVYIYCLFLTLFTPTREQPSGGKHIDLLLALSDELHETTNPIF